MKTQDYVIYFDIDGTLIDHRTLIASENCDSGFTSTKAQRIFIMHCDRKKNGKHSV